MNLCNCVLSFLGHKDPLQVSVRTPLSHLQEAPPEVMTAMVDEADWDFDILKLEKASNHRWVSKGPFIFYEGGGLVGFGGVTGKKNGLEGGAI